MVLLNDPILMQAYLNILNEDFGTFEIAEEGETDIFGVSDTETDRNVFINKVDENYFINYSDNYNYDSNTVHSTIAEKVLLNKKLLIDAINYNIEQSGINPRIKELIEILKDEGIQPYDVHQNCLSIKNDNITLEIKSDTNAIIFNVFDGQQLVIVEEVPFEMLSNDSYKVTLMIYGILYSPKIQEI